MVRAPEGVEQVAEQPPASLMVQQVDAAPVPFVWWEAEQPSATNFPPSDRQPFAPATDAEAAILSDRAWMGVEGKRDETLFLEYQVDVPISDAYFFYSRKFWRHGPFRWRWDDQPWQTATADLYLMDSAPLRQLVDVNWVSLGKVNLSTGSHKLRIELMEQDGAAAFDCFTLTLAPLQPRGKLKPNQRYTADLPEWFVFDPESDPFVESPIDLRSLNETVAGENGFIRVNGAAFVHENTDQPVRFWAVNVGAEAIQMDQPTRTYAARFLAKQGVNLVRIHGKLWADDFRQIEPETLDRLFAFIAALKQEGIYTCLSIYFPVWLQLDSHSGFPGYDKQQPFSLLFFNPDFQRIYNGWWRSLLTTVNPYTGKSLSDDPTVAMVELVNEDSTLFWSFQPYQTIPAPQMAILERQFGDWLTQTYGSLKAAHAAWARSPVSQGTAIKGDEPDLERVGIMPLSDIIAAPAAQRSKDTVAFLTQTQTQFFQKTIQYLRQELGYKSLIYASNWITADARLLGPLDKYTNTIADFMDRHGYFEPPHEGERAGYAVSPGDTYQDRSALLFTSRQPDQANDFNLPIMDLGYNGLPSTITEINWTMPNRFRADFPLLAAAYGLLQGTDGFFFFAKDKPAWTTALSKFSIASPVIMGQFPATALMYRKGLLQSGDRVVDVPLKLDDLFNLRGAPLIAPQNLDQFRAQDVPPGQVQQRDRPQSIDPLAFLVGNVNLRFTNQTEPSRISDLSPFIDRQAKTVRSSTGQLVWDYQKGLVTVNAPLVQGATGFLKQAGSLDLDDVAIASDLDYGTILLVSLDDQPLARSRRMLLQVMSEEQNFGWSASGHPQKTIQNLGQPPLVVRKLSGQISLRRSDASTLSVTALDNNGYVADTLGNASQITLRPDTLYYVIEPPAS